MNEIGAAIGVEQLKKLPGIVSNRQAFVAKLIPALSELKTIDIPELLPNSTHAYWWWNLIVNGDNASCTKSEYCDALQAEGVSMNPSYMGALPHIMDWFKNKNVFGTSQLPWSSSDYKGDPDQEFPTPNALHTMDTHFNMEINESWGDAEAALVIEAFQKVDAVYSK